MSKKKKKEEGLDDTMKRFLQTDPKEVERLEQEKNNKSKSSKKN